MRCPSPVEVLSPDPPTQQVAFMAVRQSTKIRIILGKKLLLEDLL